MIEGRGRRDQRQAPRRLQQDGRGQAAAGAGQVAHQAGILVLCSSLFDIN